uniref:Telomerase reverse transcriptase n=1 Tax=Hyaloperonospora arabidopsidis (strain Emoy2) TaxID=559515 RepID=M4BFD9_HYAAE
MMHLLLYYTILTQLKEGPTSYMQLAGKSLRQQKCHYGDDSAKRTVSIHRVMYARYFQEDRVFASSHVLAKALKTGNPISRTEASRLLRSIFPAAAGQKRLPKRLVNLIPTIQTMVSRFKTCQIQGLAKTLTPLNAGFRKFMADNPSIKRKLAEKAAEAKVCDQPILFPIVQKSLDDGYLSQSEVAIPSSDRKRKQREQALGMLSHASAVEPESGNRTYSCGKKKPKNVDTSSVKTLRVHEQTDLTKLQRHKADIDQLLTFATPKQKIYRLVRKFVARVIPKELWGSCDTQKNWKCVKMLLHKLIFSRKFDVFSLSKVSQ